MLSAVQLCSDLKSEIRLLESKFLAPWLPAQPYHRPEDFQHDVKAYCLLAHAAFEEFVEELSLLALKVAKEDWLAKKFSHSTTSLLMSYRGKLIVQEDEECAQDRLFDQIRSAIDECISNHSTSLANNHGFGLRYLRAIFTPVGIEVPDTLKLMESLRELAAARGSFAHSLARRAMYGEWKRADRPMAPEKARETVQDCFELCEQLARNLP